MFFLSEWFCEANIGNCANALVSKCAHNVHPAYEKNNAIMVEHLPGNFSDWISISVTLRNTHPVYSYTIMFTVMFTELPKTPKKTSKKWLSDCKVVPPPVINGL